MTRDEALKKIKKCLALGRSANEHEAGAALRQAQKLMEQFGLQEQDVSLTDVHEVKVKARSTAANRWETALVRLVARAFACEFYSLLTEDYNDFGNYVRSHYWVFVGLDAAPTIAGYAGDVLLRQCAMARRDHIAKQPRNCKSTTKTARGDLFASGWVAGAAEKVTALSQPEGNKALVLEHMKRNHAELQPGKIRDSIAGTKTDWGHFSAGVNAGKAAQLHHGVGGTPAQGLLT